ncbi:MAG: MazG family protein [Sporichthyaceae bacterium]
MTDPRLVLLSTSPRVAPGLMSSQAWSVLREGRVLVGSPDHPVLPYLEAADVPVEVVPALGPRALAELLVAEAAAHGVAVWLVADDGDSALGLALTGAVSAAPTPPELEMLPGSYDLPGAALLDLVAVMDRLRSPGGCPWDAKQTHESLVTYLVEEAYEAIEAIETGDRDHLREELGDLLLQVVFHARIAVEYPDSPWSIDDVAADIVAKLVRRHPHVFADVHAPTAEHVEANWEVLKAAEKGRESAVDGVPTGLPALALAAKLMSRATKAAVPVSADPDDSSFGGRLLRLVAEAQAAGADAEAELRAAARRYAAAVRAAETGPAERQ